MNTNSSALFTKKLLFTAALTLVCSILLGQTILINPSSPFLVPAGVTSITIECWGGGGGGGGGQGGSIGSQAGGGGGGGSAVMTFSVSSGDSYTITKGSGGTGGSTSGGNGTVGGNSMVSGPGGTCIAYGGPGGKGDAGTVGGTVSGAVAGTGGYAGGQGIGGHFASSSATGGGGGGGAGNAGPGSDGIRGTGSGVSAGGAGGIGNPNAAPYIGGSGGNGPISTSNAIAGSNGNIPGGGGGGGANYSGSSGAKGGNGGAGQVIILYNVIPTCTVPCAGWIAQSCSTCTKGCYIDGGTIIPSNIIQTKSISADTGNYGYIFWTINAIADSTYYFDLCSSTGTAGVSWLRLHNGRTSGNNYCMDTSSTPTKILENISNGCAGTGSGLSKIIWTCQASGTYYLETAVGINMIPWGISSSQTAVLSYKTLPSYSFVCSDVFYDKGIDGTNGSSSSYNNDENWIYTYYPIDTMGSAISAQFISFSTSPGDVLCVYDGSSINAPLIGCYGGPSITGTFTSTASNGSLTFQFISDDSLVSTGWQANISCIANVAVGNNASANKIRIFPNPAKDQLEISGLNADANTSISIFDVVGKSVSANMLISQLIPHNSQPKITLNISDLSAGIYFLRIENESGRWNGRFEKQ